MPNILFRLLRMLSMDATTMSCSFTDEKRQNRPKQCSYVSEIVKKRSYVFFALFFLKHICRKVLFNLHFIWKRKIFSFGSLSKYFSLNYICVLSSFFVFFGLKNTINDKWNDTDYCEIIVVIYHFQWKWRKCKRNSFSNSYSLEKSQERAYDVNFKTLDPNILETLSLDFLYFLISTVEGNLSMMI